MSEKIARIESNAQLEDLLQAQLFPHERIIWTGKNSNKAAWQRVLLFKMLTYLICAFVVAYVAADTLPVTLGLVFVLTIYDRFFSKKPQAIFALTNVRMLRVLDGEPSDCSLDGLTDVSVNPVTSGITLKFLTKDPLRPNSPPLAAYDDSLIYGIDNPAELRDLVLKAASERAVETANFQKLLEQNGQVDDK
jgi:hypothetical protein